MIETLKYRWTVTMSGKLHLSPHTYSVGFTNIPYK